MCAGQWLPLIAWIVHWFSSFWCWSLVLPSEIVAACFTCTDRLLVARVFSDSPITNVKVIYICAHREEHIPHHYTMVQLVTVIAALNGWIRFTSWIFQLWKLTDSQKEEYLQPGLEITWSLCVSLSRDLIIIIVVISSASNLKISERLTNEKGSGAR